MIALDHAALVPALSILFEKVLVPKAVRAELFKRRNRKDRLQALLADYAFIERCDGYDPGAVRFLLAERQRHGLKDKGEVETVVQASQFGASVLIDDRWGRALAHRFSLTCHGTLWVVEQLYGMQFLSPKDANIAIDKMLGRGIRLPREAVASFRSRVK